jgi:hypothetical protein
MANIFTSLLRELPWFEHEQEDDREEQAKDHRAELKEARKPKPYVPSARPDNWLPS